jgi:hypothetical protein
MQKPLCGSGDPERVQPILIIPPAPTHYDSAITSEAVKSVYAFLRPITLQLRIY